MNSLKPRIGLVVPSLALGGGVPAVARFLKNTIVDCGRFDLSLISLSTSASDPCSVRLAAPVTWARGVVTARGIWEELPYLHVGAVAGELEFQRYRRRALLSRVISDCDLIQVVCGTPAWANSVLGLGKPVALQVATRARIERRRRDAEPRGLSGRWRKAMTRITDRMDDQALGLVDAIQVENPWMLDYARKFSIGRDVDLRYAPPGVDADLFCPPDRLVARKERYILCVGRLSDPRKNVELLLEAYVLLPLGLRAEVRLVLAGSSGPPESFWRRVQALGIRDRVSYVERPDSAGLIRLYQAASVFALPSDEEGLGVVLLEAMACAVPVVSTRSGGPDGIIRDGEDGFLVGLNDPLGFSNRLAQVLQNRIDSEAIGRKARKTIERRYDRRITGAVFVDMWDRMAHRAGSP